MSSKCLPSQDAFFYEMYYLIIKKTYQGPSMVKELPLQKVYWQQLIEALRSQLTYSNITTSFITGLTIINCGFEN